MSRLVFCNQVALWTGWFEGIYFLREVTKSMGKKLAGDVNGTYMGEVEDE